MNRNTFSDDLVCLLVRDTLYARQHLLGSERDGFDSMKPGFC